MFRFCAVFFALVLSAWSPTAIAQPSPIPDRLAVFLDCRTSGCDRNFLITELPYVVWTQDRLDAEVHILVTGLETGAGGVEYTIALIGQRRFDARVDTVTTSIPPNTTDDARRREIARTLSLSLVPYIMQTRAAGRLIVTQVESYEQPQSASQLNDPWNLWVYRISASGDGDIESRSREYSIEGSLEANRVTERSKIVLDADYQYEGNAFTLSNGEEREFILREYDFDARFVRSITDHWSLGVSSSTGMTEFENQNLALASDVGVEYNLFPWRDATRRQLVAIATIGARYFSYDEETIYRLTSETRPSAAVIVAGETRQAWGSVEASLEHSRYLHDAATYRLNFDASISLRISRGLSLNLGGYGQKVNDQLFLPRGDATDEEVLTRQRALATAYRYGARVGLSFTFGSIYNTIVNPRFDRAN